MTQQLTIQIEPWRKQGLTILGNRWTGLVSACIFGVVFCYYLLILSGIIPFSFGLGVIPDSAGRWVVTEAWRPASDFGVKVGDILIEADGQTELSHVLVDKAQSFRFQNATGKSFYTVSYDQIHESPVYGQTIQLVFGLLAFIYFMTGLLIYLYSRQRDPAIFFFRCCFFLSLTFLFSAVQYRGVSNRLILALTIFLAAVAAANMLLFFIVFPQSAKLILPKKLAAFFPFNRLVLLIYGLTALVGLSGLLYVASVVFLPLLRFSMVLLLAGSMVTSFVISLIKAFKSKQTQTLVELRVIAVSLVISFGPFLLVLWLPDYFIENYRPPTPIPALIYCFLMVLPLGFVYAIVQFQSLGIRNLVRRDLLRLLLTLILSTFYMLIFIVTDHVVGENNFGSQFVIVSIFGLVITLSFNQLQRLLSQLLDRFFFRDFYEYKTALQEFTAHLTQPNSLEEVASVVLNNLIQIFNLEQGALTIMRRTPPQPAVVSYNKIARRNNIANQLLPAELEYLTRLEMPRPDQIFLIWYDSQEPPLTTLEIELEKDTFLNLTLGAKLSEETFNTDDVLFIETLIGPLRSSVQKVFLINELEQKVHELQNHSEQLRQSRDELGELSQYVLRLSEEERIRLAREIHDDPLQQLMLILRQFDPEDPTITPREKTAWQIADQVSATLRQICQELRPPHLDDMGLVAALESLAFQLSEDYGVCVQTDLDFDIPPLNPKIELVLYRAAQEAMQNALKHSQAETIELELSREDELLILRVRDNGLGFQRPYNPAQLVSEGHLGLLGLRERVQSVSGLLTLESQPGLGTLLEVRIALLD